MENETAKRAREIFAEQLNYYMKLKGINQSDIVSHFKLTASTVSDWCNGKKYPRVDKIQMLADYFGVLKSDLTEKKPITNDELKENIVIYHRDGKTSEIKLTKEKMDMLAKMIEAIKDDDVDL